MKHSKAQTRGKARLSIELRFEPQALTSYAGLILFQHFFAKIHLKERLWACFRHLPSGAIYGHHAIVLVLIVHLILGHRRLRDVEYYRQDEMVRRTVGLQRLPDASTISRNLAGADEHSVEQVRCESRRLVTERLRTLAPARVTVDFDGSVLSTGRHAEGTAVGFNKKKKGLRSYYPLFCTIAQTDQVLDVHHRPGNVHDSNGAIEFMTQCFGHVRDALPRTRIETRIDSAFFDDDIADHLHAQKVSFTISVPFERFPELKSLVENRLRWKRVSDTVSCFESFWKPNCWNTRYRFLFIRQQVKRQEKGVLQLDLFRPVESGFDFKVIVTNRRGSVRKIVAFHEGRGSQEGIFAELKSQCQMDYIPVNSCVGNQLYRYSAILAHNLTRELQMQTTPRRRGTTARRAALWCFQELATLRRTLICHAGRFIRPAGQVILSMNTNHRVERELLQSLDALQNSAA